MAGPPLYEKIPIPAPDPPLTLKHPRPIVDKPSCKG